jgi:hypothetical protein
MRKGNIIALAVVGAAVYALRRVKPAAPAVATGAALLPAVNAPGFAAQALPLPSQPESVSTRTQPAASDWDKLQAIDTAAVVAGSREWSQVRESGQFLADQAVQL